MTGQRVAIIGSHAQYLANFRGALMQDMRACGHEVLALAPDFDAGTRSELSALGVEAVDISLSRTGMNPVWDVRDIIGLHAQRSDEHTSELQSLMRISYAVFFLKKKQDTYYNSQLY